MSLPRATVGLISPLRLAMLALVLAVLAGCGQKGDLYRPGQSQKPAAIAEAPARS